MRPHVKRRLILSAVSMLSLAAAGAYRHALAQNQAWWRSQNDWMDLDWMDASRDRLVPVRLYLPRQDAPRAFRSPLVVFSHGLGGSRRGYSYLARHFANNGITSLHIQHVGSDSNVWGGHVFGLVERLAAALQTDEAMARVQDLSFALDKFFDSSFAAHVDQSRVAAAGHSYGANTALLAAGAKIIQNAQLTDLSDRRIRAAVAISAPHYYGRDDSFRSLSSVSVPSLHITATQDNIKMPGYFSGVQDRLNVYEATGSAMKWLAVFEGGSHSVFTDRMGTGGMALNPKVKLATSELATVFLSNVFEGDNLDAHAWAFKHAEIIAKSEFKHELKS